MTDHYDPIGIFDSGVGGLSVLRELRRLMPFEDFLYFADHAWSPYGTRSAAEIADRATKIARFLTGHRARAVVIACNTATIAGVHHLRSQFDIPIIGTEPAVRPASLATRRRVVGVLATEGTLNGPRYGELVDAAGAHVRVLSQACSGLASQIETGDLDSPATRSLVERYVTPLIAGGADSIVLGCTHYAFIRPLIKEIAGPDVQIFDSATGIARHAAHVMNMLRNRNQPVDRNHRGTITWFSSGDAGNVAVLTKLWGEPIDVQGVDPDDAPDPS